MQKVVTLSRNFVLNPTGYIPLRSLTQPFSDEYISYLSTGVKFVRFGAEEFPNDSITLVMKASRRTIESTVVSSFG